MSVLLLVSNFDKLQMENKILTERVFKLVEDFRFVIFASELGSPLR